MPAIDVCVNWAFLHNVLPSSSMISVAREFIENYSGLIVAVESFAQKIPDLLRGGNKSELVYLIFDEFSDIAKSNEL